LQFKYYNLNNGNSVSTNYTGSVGAVTVYAGLSSTNQSTLGNGVIHAEALVTDAVGNQTLAGSFDFKLDTVVPTLTSATILPGTYGLGTKMSVDVTWSEAFKVVSGSPIAALSSDSGWLNATYNSASSSGAHTVFDYNIAAGNLDTNGISFTGINYNSANYGDLAGNKIYGINQTIAFGNVKVDSGLDITSVTTPSAGDYAAGNTIRFKLNTVSNIQVGTDSKLLVNVGDKSFYATYDITQSTSDNVLDFTYLVGEGRISGSPDMRQITSLEGTTMSLLDTSGNNLFLLVDGVGSLTNVKVDYSVL